jgi:hypothetical protein
VASIAVQNAPVSMSRFAKTGWGTGCDACCKARRRAALTPIWTEINGPCGWILRP